MNSKEYWQGIRDIEARRVKAERLVALKAEREQAARQKRQARETAEFLKYLPPERIYQPQPRLQMPAGFGGLRPSPRPEDLARRSQKVDEILSALEEVW